MGNFSNLPEVEICESCGETDVSVELVDSRFEYNHHGALVTLVARVPVYTCGACEFQYMAADAEDARHNAVCDYLELLPPKVVRQIRVTMGMTIRELSAVTGIGSASLSRWENGSGIQNRAYDNLLRLVRDPANLQFLSSSRSLEVPSHEQAPNFRSLKVTASVMDRANAFSL
ncbi:MAG: type II TA system antitoxin MqsA family protein [Pseudohongiella sp.]|uniref:type II TA system antitoxin MqsA family protein n=1 Tax=Pseudohongiella sp. TaxID=1979412 RepID=UPI0034A087C5